MAKDMTDEERYGKVGAAIRRLDPEAYKNRPKTMEGNLKLLEELRSRAKADVEPIAKGPSARRGTRTPAAQSDETPGRRFGGTYGETREAMASLSPEQKSDALKMGVAAATGAAGMGRMAAARAAKAAGDVGRAGSVNLRGMTMAEREREAAAAAEYAKRMKRMKETAEARSRMGRGAAYKKGGVVKSSASRRADGIASKGKTRGKLV